jgi:hypothetical protein
MLLVGVVFFRHDTLLHFLDEDKVRVSKKTRKGCASNVAIQQTQDNVDAVPDASGRDHPTAVLHGSEHSKSRACETNAADQNRDPDILLGRGQIGLHGIIVKLSSEGATGYDCHSKESNYSHHQVDAVDNNSGTTSLTSGGGVRNQVRIPLQ